MKSHSRSGAGARRAPRRRSCRRRARSASRCRGRRPTPRSRARTAATARARSRPAGRRRRRAGPDGQSGPVYARSAPSWTWRPAWSTRRCVARAEPGEVLLGAGVPLGRDAQRRAVELELEQDRLGVGDRHAQPPRAAALAADRDLERRRRAARRRSRPRRARAGPSSSRATTPSVNWMNRSCTSPSTAHTPSPRTSRRPPRRTSIGERALRDLHAQRAALEHVGAAERRGENRHPTRGSPPRRRSVARSHQGHSMRTKTFTNARRLQRKVQHRHR